MGEARGPEFNDAATCPKCFHDDVVVIYRKDSHEWGCRDHRPGGRECCGDEHFDRICQRCHYGWREEVWSPAPAVPVPEEAP